MAAPMRYVFRNSIARCTVSHFIPSINGQSLRCFNSNRHTITRVRRAMYARLYPTLLVQPDGSTIRIRYHVPQKIIHLPIDVTQLSEEHRKMHIDKHKVRQRVVIEEEDEDSFSSDTYSHLWKDASLSGSK